MPKLKLSFTQVRVLHVSQSVAYRPSLLYVKHASSRDPTQRARSAKFAKQSTVRTLSPESYYEHISEMILTLFRYYRSESNDTDSQNSWDEAEFIIQMTANVLLLQNPAHQLFPVTLSQCSLPSLT